jgi:glycosyltransferase involved in cell wall biosynthesis
MRVIHLSHSDINGGAARAAYRIHHSLLKKSVKSMMWVNKATSGDETVTEPISKVDKLINYIKPRLINYSLCKTLKSKNEVLLSPSVIPSRWVKLINNSNADIVHLHWIQHEMLSIKDISKIKKPIIWTLHDMWGFCGAEHFTADNRWCDGYNNNNIPNYESGFDLNRWTWQRKKKYWKNPIQIITPSKWLSSCVKKSKLMSEWPVSVIPNPLNTKIWRPLNKKIAREQLNLSSDVPLILFGAIGGTKDYNKGFDLLISALEYMKIYPNIKKSELVVFGEGEKKSLPNLGLPIHFMGHLHDDISLRVLYSAADVMIVPSRNETFGQTASEAHACGTAVVSFDVGGLKDIVQHKKTGYLAKAFDTKDLATGISWVLENYKDKKFNEAARNQANKKFKDELIADEYIKIYNKVLTT